VEPNPVRSLTDEQVLRALMRHRRLTRAELAAEIGISRPTAGESVRRLAERGLLADTGERTPGGRGMGRVGQYYALADPGSALVVGIAPTGIVAELIDAYGDTLHRASRPAPAAAVVQALQEVALLSCTPPAVTLSPGTASAGSSEVSRAPSPTGPVTARPRLAVVSAADPVDRGSGRLVHLPDAPFLVGSLDPVAVLAPYVDGPVLVDNDVNWAARAEPAPDDFAYLFLGEGLGCAIVSDGAVRRGRTGLAGEIAHVLTTGADGRATPFIEVFRTLGLRQPASSAIDVPALLAAPSEDRTLIAGAVAGVVAAIVALADPAEIVVGGGWGPALLPDIIAAVATTPRPVPLRAGRTADPSLTAARQDALDRLRTQIIDSASALTRPSGRPA
jgi:predicted NBD/HSP70 family sugar kinase/DNA-binding transcriptional ArsR family regulator